MYVSFILRLFGQIADMVSEQLAQACASGRCMDLRQAMRFFVEVDGYVGHLSHEHVKVLHSFMHSTILSRAPQEL
jgi:hypothetical protein